MNDLLCELSEKWEQALLAGKSDREWRAIALSGRASVGIFAAVREPDERIAVLIEAPLITAPRALFEFRADGVSVADQRRVQEGVCRFALTLEKVEVCDVFKILAADIMARRCVTLVGVRTTPNERVSWPETVEPICERKKHAERCVQKSRRH
jgi:hypothetical protein